MGKGLVFCLISLALTLKISFECSLDLIWLSWLPSIAPVVLLFLTRSNMAHGLTLNALFMGVASWLANPRCQPPVFGYLLEGIKAFSPSVL